jgi:phage shock protein PspC (stress-responsive transcriptional regulator)
MVRRKYRYSLDRRDAKIAGVCSAIGERLGIDPTFIRIGFVSVPVLTPVTFVHALIIYAVVGVIMAVQNGGIRATRKQGEFEEMGNLFRRRPSVHDMRTKLDEEGRRRMAVDHHLSKQNDELAREIEALREDK